MNIAKFDSRFVTVEISRIIEENATTKTFVFKYPLGGRPGQFLMIWLPGMDEKPMSVAYDNGEEFWVTICKVGPFSEAMHRMEVGDKVGVRGPLGTYYRFGEGEHLALVSGGYGAAPMYFVAHEALRQGCKVEFLVGARNADLLLYTDQVLGLGDDIKLHISTDDGSMGYKGYVTEVLDKILEKEKITKVFTCGPEVMMKIVGEIAEKHGVKAWMSMEKYMKCGVGVCGQCAIDDSGDLICKQGPVMSRDSIKNLPELGKYHRDAQGKKHYN